MPVVSWRERQLCYVNMTIRPASIEENLVSRLNCNAMLGGPTLRISTSRPLAQHSILGDTSSKAGHQNEMSQALDSFN